MSPPPTRVVGWKAFYLDHTYTSKLIEWKDLPEDGLQVVILYYDVKDGMGRPTRLILSGQTWYFSDGDQLFGANNDGLEENKQRYPTCTFKRGKWIRLADLEKIRQTSMGDYEV